MKQVLNFKNNIILIKDEYGNFIDTVIGASKKNKFIKERIDAKWFGINPDEDVSVYRKKDLFVSPDEQYRIGKEFFQDKNKYFNDMNVTIKDKIRRIARYGLIIEEQKQYEYYQEIQNK